MDTGWGQVSSTWCPGRAELLGRKSSSPQIPSFSTLTHPTPESSRHHAKTPVGVKVGGHQDGSPSPGSTCKSMSSADPCPSPWSLLEGLACLPFPADGGRGGFTPPGLSLMSGKCPVDCHAKATAAEPIKAMAHVGEVPSSSARNDPSLPTVCPCTMAASAPASETLKRTNSGCKLGSWLPGSSRLHSKPHWSFTHHGAFNMTQVT